MLQLCVVINKFFSLKIFVVSSTKKTRGKFLEKCIFPRVNLTKFANFFGNFCQHFDIKKIWKKKKKKNLVMM
jgi:hypothetical protein